MKAIFLTLLLFVSIPSSHLNKIRTSFKDASTNELHAESFYELVNSETYDDAVYKAYAGASETILSKYFDSNIEKLKHFRQGVESIETAVDEDASNTEIRFVRLVIQLNSPDFLNYDENIEEDKDFVLEHYSGCSGPVQKMIRDYASMSDYFSESEKSQLK